MAVLTEARPHDLLRISSATDLMRTAPPWVGPALARAPWVVVRRDSRRPGFVPVGIRGTSRAQRYGTMASLEDIVESLSPSGLLDRVDRLSDVPAAAALRLAADVLNPAGIDWGPGGSTGFTLASGVTVVTADSDLDVVIRAETLPPAAELMRWHDGMRLLPGRVDCQLDLPCGGLALAELVGPNPRVLLRTETGPRLVTRDALRP